MSPAPVALDLAYFRDRTVVDENGCWIWQLLIGSHGYGQLKTRHRAQVPTGAHRASYEALVGPIPEGLQIDHLCRVRACCNPAHLEPVTQSENNRRIPPESRPPGPIGWRHLRHDYDTHCVNGHEWVPANIYVAPSRPGARMCRACMKSSQVEYKRRKRLGLPGRQEEKRMAREGMPT